MPCYKSHIVYEHREPASGITDRLFVFSKGTMPQPLHHAEIVLRCLRRIQSWQHAPTFAALERDWMYFVSAFPEHEMCQDQILLALMLLEETGYIRVAHPRPLTDPEAFLITYRPKEMATNHV